MFHPNPGKRFYSKYFLLFQQTWSQKNTLSSNAVQLECVVHRHWMYFTYCILVSIIRWLQCSLPSHYKSEAIDFSAQHRSQRQLLWVKTEVLAQSGRLSVQLENHLSWEWFSHELQMIKENQLENPHLLLWKLLSQVVTNLGTRNAVLISSLCNQ